MLKRFISILLTVSVMLTVIPSQLAFAESEDAETLEISNQYIKVTVSKENGGYVISTLEGDLLKKSDDNVQLTHRGESFDTSFTSFRINSDEYVFGNKYGIFEGASSSVVTQIEPSGDCITSTWSIGDCTVEQRLSLVNNNVSEQLGTAMISYTFKNGSSSTKSVKSRVLIDTQLGKNDYGYYEVPKQNLGQGYEYFEFEKTWDSSVNPTVRMPSDYFVRDNPFSSEIVAFGVNSVFAEQKPYKMTFAHWSNIAATVFDYTPDESLNFTNRLNAGKTADSAAALYYDLGSIAPGQEKTFSTCYGVTANLKNRENKIIINTTAPSKLEFTDSTRTAYKGSGGTDNVVRINVNLTNPKQAGKNRKKLAVVAYAIGFDTQRQTDSGAWVEYNNADPICSEIIDFKAGENRVTYFDFKFTPKERAQLGTFVIKVFDMDEEINELQHYAEDFCLGSAENHIIIPGKDSTLPAITLTGLAPDIIYNNDIRYITVSGRGTEFFRSDLLNRIELRGEDGTSYNIPIENLIFEQGGNSSGVSIMLDEYMKPGRYSLHFLWKNGTNEPAIAGLDDFTSDAMVVQVSSDIKYSNSYYGVITVQRGGNNKYTVVPYKNESEFEKAGLDEEKLLLSFRGDISRDKSRSKFYRLLGKDKDVNINHILNYHGGDLTLEEKDNGSVEILMDGKITTIGANTTVRNGTAAFRLECGTEYIIPEYSEDGTVEENGELSGNQDFIELKWDNAFDTLTTVGGFLIDMKYGILGKIKNSDNTKSDIISFGGSLDLGFMTPGGAAAMRQNTAAGARWTTDYVETQHDDLDDGYTFGLTFDEDAGEFRSQVTEKDIAPSNNDASRVEAGASIHDILYGGKNPGYIGINMEANITLPQLVKFLPNKIEGNLSVNTINGYRVGVDADVETANFSMGLSLVVRSAPSGAPVPDKLYFTIGGFEPGVNVDGLGVLWVTGGGGGFDNLYDTIYGKDGVPPLTLLLHAEFDITKILTGNADLELSLRSLKVSFDDLSLKMLKDAKFIEGGEVAVGWYPNFNLNLSAGVNFMQIMNGSFTICAAAGKGTADFVQFVLNVSLGLPKYIPIVGGMELASAELGGGSQKVWGAVELLSLIKVGFTYYWGGSIEFTHGSPSGSQNFAVMSQADDAGVKRTKMLFNNMLEPLQVGTDPKTGEKQFASVGGNLSYIAGSTAVADFDERVRNSGRFGVSTMSLQNARTEIFTNTERTSHLVSFGDVSDYILSISRADGSEISESDLRGHLSLKQGDSAYELRYYTNPGHGAADIRKKEALERANINITGSTAYIVIPKSDTARDILLEFSDGKAYDISAIRVNPLSTLTSCGAQMNGNTLTVNWDGENISDSAKIIVSASDGDSRNDIVLNETEISAKAKSADIQISDKIPSGEYIIKLTLSDENVCYDSYHANKVTITNPKAPGGIEGVTIENCGDDKLKINVLTDAESFDGYLVEVYEDGRLADTGLYFKKGEEIIVGGQYEIPVLDEDGNPTGQTVKAGYTPGKEYSARVRLCNIAEDTDGNEVYHCGAAKTSSGPNPILKASTRPSVDMEYDKASSSVKISSDVPISGELYINSDTKNREWYEFPDESTSLSRQINLADGDYTIEFYAKDGDGDHAIVQKIISVDTTAPVILLSSPTSGGSFGGDSITVTAAADKDAEYSFAINGNAVLPLENDIFTGEMLRCTLPLGESKNLAKISLEIIAKDSSGNETSKKLLLTNKSLSEITSVSVLSDGREITSGKLTLNAGESTELKVLGTTENGDKIDITDMPGTALEIAGGSAAELDGTKITAVSDGQTLVRAGFSLGGNEALYDGIIVEAAEKSPEHDSSSSSSGGAALCTVLFNTNGGSTVPSQRIKSGAKASEPENPVKTGYIFGGWYTDKNLTEPYNFSTAVTKGFTLYAKWNEDANGGVIPDHKLPFADVSASDWFFEYVKYVFENKLMNGVSDDLFAPNASLTRAMLVTILHRKAGEPDADGSTTFADVDMNAYYASAVIRAQQNGIVNGITENEFAPNRSITREQAAAIIYRYAKHFGYDVQIGDSTSLTSYDDFHEISDYAVPAMQYAVGSGLMKGKSAETLNPQDTATRAEIAAVLQRFAELTE